MRFVEIEIVFADGYVKQKVNVSVPDDFYEWAEDILRLKYLFNMPYYIDHNKKTIYNAAFVKEITITEDV